MIYTVFQSGSQGSADSYAREALSHWRFLIGQPGCWDPFVLRHAEVMSMDITSLSLHILIIVCLGVLCVTPVGVCSIRVFICLVTVLNCEVMLLVI